MAGGSKKHFVLVHGASLGAWCWYKVRCRLEQLGHQVTCLDLAGSGVDLTDPSTIASFHDYNKPLLDFMSSLPASPQPPVVLVGHSMGGLSLTSIIRGEFGSKVETAVYVAANMLRDGFATPKDIQAGSPDLSSELGDGSKEMRSPNGVLTEEFQKLLLFHRSPPEDATLAAMLMRPPPAIGPLLLSGGAAGGVRRVYIKAQEDKIIKPWQQEMMIEMWPPSQVLSLDSDHCPFFSASSQLSELLHQM